MRVLFLPHVIDDLLRLVRILVKEGYLGSYESAMSYVNDIVNYVQQKIHIAYIRKAPISFIPKVSDLFYLTYRRNRRTIWYIFFTMHEDMYLVRQISNNHVLHKFLEN